MATLISHSAADTRAIGERWGREAQDKWIIALSGDLGAGKTQLVKGIAAGLGSPARVHSPTFALLNIYEGGRLVMHHVDLYRLQSADQVWAAGLGEYIGLGLTVIEWGERLWHGQSAPSLPGSFVRHARIEAVGETERRIIYENTGH